MTRDGGGKNTCDDCCARPGRTGMLLPREIDALIDSENRIANSNRMARVSQKESRAPR